MLRLVSSRADAIRRQTARWFVRRDRDEIDVDDDLAFDTWLDADPAHEASFARAEAIMARLDGEGASQADLAAIAALREEIAGYRPASRPRWRPGAWALAASFVAAVSFIAFEVSNIDERAPVVASLEKVSVGSAFATAVGEQKTVRLADGSRVTLNTASSITVDYRADRRLIRLVRGQALFDVAHDSDRPFSVVTDSGTITALGTIFEVQADRGELVVTLVKGSVVVDEAAAVKPSGGGKRTTLLPGQQLVVGDAHKLSVEAIDIDQRLLWRKSMVQFSDTPLAEAVGELNRYTRVPIRIRGEKVGALRVSGIFEADDPANFAAMIAAMLPVEAEENMRGEIELRAREPAP